MVQWLTLPHPELAILFVWNFICSPSPEFSGWTTDRKKKPQKHPGRWIGYYKLLLLVNEYLYWQPIKLHLGQALDLPQL